MPMSSRQVALAAALSFAITACAQPPAAPMALPASSTAPADQFDVPSVPPAKDVDAMSEPAVAAPERGPAIPAAELSKRLLALFGSFRSLKDLERGHVEDIMQSPLTRRSGMEDGYQYFGMTTEGWNYRIAVERLERIDEPPTIDIYLNNGVDPDANQQPTYCTLEFEPLAKELVAMGYARSEKMFRLKGKQWWGFHRKNPQTNADIGAMVYVYRIPEGDGDHYCISSMNIDGDSLNE